MIRVKDKSFSSKILLFGEYTLIKGSMALSIPFEKYTGQLLFDQSAKKSKSNHYSVAYLVDYFNFLKESRFGKQINLNVFKEDIEQGLIFETNIPISYGLGSSGAIVASIYNAYSLNKSENLDELKTIFSNMESYYHGKSSGLDPLVSYLNKAILINKQGELKTVDLLENNKINNSGIFLIDTKTVGETQPLVSWFLNEYKKYSFKNKIENNLIPLNNNAIESYLSGDFSSLLKDIKSISQFTLENFKPMIPPSIEKMWKKGLETDNYYLKLCGSGGGGMMIGFTDNIEKSTNELDIMDTHLILT